MRDHSPALPAGLRFGHYIIDSIVSGEHDKHAGSPPTIFLVQGALVGLLWQ
jgi:hypothetical protein